MSKADIEKGLRDGWLVPDTDGWSRFVWDFIPHPTQPGQYAKQLAKDTKRVRIYAG